jgi:hypothetical protein
MIAIKPLIWSTSSDGNTIAAPTPTMPDRYLIIKKQGDKFSMNWTNGSVNLEETAKFFGQKFHDHNLMQLQSQWFENKEPT